MKALRLCSVALPSHYSHQSRLRDVTDTHSKCGKTWSVIGNETWAVAVELGVGSGKPRGW